VNILDRIAQAWQALLGRPTRSETDAQAEIVSLRRRLGETTLQLHESEQMLNFQKSQMEHLGSTLDCCENDPLDSRIEDLVASLSQLRMQGSLLQAGTEISGRSVMALAGKLADSLEKAGLEPVGITGAEIEYDPEACEPLSTASAFVAGETVIVKFIGYRYRGRLVRKALVQRKD